MKFLLMLTLLFSSAQSTPFEINFPEKKDLTNEDYIEIQNQMRQIDIQPLLKEMYRSIEGCGYTTLEDFLSRITKGINQCLIDPEKGRYPEKELIKIGHGGDRCFVCSVPFSGKYPDYVKSLIEGLREVGFNGYMLYYMGGWPNPTGEEIKYVAVPYSFKIFAMVEASLLGFTNVLWVDSACYPLRNVEPLFDIIDQKGALLNWFYLWPDAWRFLFPQTRSCLSDLTRSDVLCSKYINTIVFGLKMNGQVVGRLVERYYEFVRLGYPFLSCFPEEWVLTALLGSSEFQTLTEHAPPWLVQRSFTDSEDSPEEFEAMRCRDIYFYHRRGR